MRIAIFDAKHFEVAYTAMRLFAAGGNELYLCVNAELHRLFAEAIPDEMGRHHWLVHDRPGEEKAYLDRLGRMLDEEAIDLLWIATIDNNYFKAAQVARHARHTAVVMGIHNLNHWLGGPRWTLSVRPWRAFLSRRALLNTLDGICVLEDGLAQTARESFGYRRPVLVAPGLVFDDALAETPPADVPTRFVIPGGIEGKRRDYRLLLDAMEAAHRVDPAVSLTLLGAPVGEYGREILARCEVLRGRGMDLRTYAGFVPQEEFHRRMKEAHCVLAPVQVETSFSGGREVYGLTKSSGTIGDILRYARPGVAPESLHAAPEMEGALLRYSDPEGFIAHVRRLTADRSARNSSVTKAVEVSRGFTPSVLYHSLEPSLARLVEARR